MSEADQIRFARIPGEPPRRAAHARTAGDFVIRDNRCINHARTDFPASEKRRLRRTTVQGVRPRSTEIAARRDRCDVDGQWRFFYPPRRERGRDAGADGEPVPLARVLDTLVRAGHGGGYRELCETLTWRQIEMFWREAERRRAAGMSDLAHALGAAPLGG